MRKLFIFMLALGAIALLYGREDPPAIPTVNTVVAGELDSGQTETAVFAGGCFWGVDAVFRHVRGVVEVESGYAGGSEDTATYKQVSRGGTGHAESVRVRFDPQRVSYHQLLEVFFTVAHDPTTHNRQGPDVGSQYRSAIFYIGNDQEREARSYMQQLARDKAFNAPIVTQLTPLQVFYRAEEYHQNFYALHRYMGYIQAHDVPKIKRLQKAFPALYREVD